MPSAHTLQSSFASRGLKEAIIGIGLRRSRSHSSPEFDRRGIFIIFQSIIKNSATPKTLTTFYPLRVLMTGSKSFNNC